MTLDQLEKVDAWRDVVVASIKAGETKYVRDTVYDRLIGLLFPDLRAALTNPFGTPLFIANEDFEAPAIAPSVMSPMRLGREKDLLLRGSEFEEWARRNPEAAKAWMESPAYKQHHQDGTQEMGGQGYTPWKRRRS